VAGAGRNWPSYEIRGVVASQLALPASFTVPMSSTIDDVDSDDARINVRRRGEQHD
jgi:hypothetical protein